MRIARNPGECAVSHVRPYLTSRRSGRILLGTLLNPSQNVIDACWPPHFLEAPISGATSTSWPLKVDSTLRRTCRLSCGHSHRSVLVIRYMGCTLTPFLHAALRKLVRHNVGYHRVDYRAVRCHRHGSRPGPSHHRLVSSAVALGGHLTRGLRARLFPTLLYAIPSRRRTSRPPYGARPPGGNTGELCRREGEQDPSWRAVLAGSNGFSLPPVLGRWEVEGQPNPPIKCALLTPPLRSSFRRKAPSPTQRHSQYARYS